jgi:hypothetical protein
MNRVPLPEAYLEWLEPQLRDENDGKSYSDLIILMFQTEFPWGTPWDVNNDDNRLADGMDLRAEFSREFNVGRTDLLGMGPVSFLEVLIGLSRRLEFAAGGSAPGWAWQLVCNLELHRMSNPLSEAKKQRVRDILETVIQRKYRPDGQGGFFPLAFPDEDQTRIEIWYQMHAFLEEAHPEH